jgi:ribosome-associated heat shock protein Hsp15
MGDGIRIDKWLWAVRIFKTRSMASSAGRAGKVKIDDQETKPSRDAHIGDVISIRVNPHFTRTVKVIGLLSNRVGAKLVPNYAEDLTPQEEYDKLKKYNELNWERRDRGIGRPTKKERRDLDSLKDF